jgi:endoglucanase Acf2
MNFATSVILWGAATGNDAVRDLGVYLYATEARAVQQYWFDVDGAVFPQGFKQSAVGMVWGNGGAYATWWTANPEEIHGINFLPITGGSLYLGWRPEYVQKNLANMAANNGGPETEWRDIIWSFQALGDAAGAVAKLDRAGDLPATSGGSQAHTYQWIHALDALGRPDAKVTADWPTAAVFDKAGSRTHAAWNPTARPITVTFSDGAKLTVPAGQLAGRLGGSVAESGR